MFQSTPCFTKSPKMPELTELDKATASMTEKRKEETASSDSDSDDTIPELEDAGNHSSYL